MTIPRVGSQGQRRAGLPTPPPGSNALLRPGSHSVRGSRDLLEGRRGLCRTPATGANDPRDLVEGLHWEDGTHLLIPGLPSPDARDGLELGKDSGAVRVDRELPPVEPLDLA